MADDPDMDGPAGVGGVAGRIPSGSLPEAGSAPDAGGGWPGVAEPSGFFDHAACGHHSLDAVGRFLLINDAELRWLGYERDELVGKRTFGDLCTPESRRLFEENFGRFKAGGTKHSVEYDLVRKDGSLLPVLLSATAVLDPEGRYVSSRATVFDLTERREMERRLREALEEQQDLYDRAPCGYHSADGEGRIVKMNRTELDWLGYAKDEVVGRLGITDLVTAESLPAIWKNVPLLKETGYIGDVEVEFRRKDGTTFPVRIYATALYDDSGSFLRSRTTVVDLTSQRRIEAALREKDLFIRRIADATPDFVFVFDLVRNRLVYGNRELSRVLGVMEEELLLLGEDLFAKLLHPDDLALRAGRREAYGSISDNDVSTVEYRLRHADGGWRWMRSRNVVFERGADGKPVQILGIAHDVTAEKEAEERIARSETLYRTLVETVPVGIGWTDSHGRLTFASAALCRLLGATSEAQVTGTRIAYWLAPRSGPAGDDRRRAPRTRGRPFELVLRRLDGTTFWAEMVTEILVSPDGAFEGQIVAVSDVTERRQATETMQRDSDRLRYLSRRIIEIQEEERRHLGRELHDEIGQTFTAILYRLEALRGSVAGDAAALLDETVRIADRAIGATRDLSLSLRPAQLDELLLSETLRLCAARLVKDGIPEVEFTICPRAEEFPAEVRSACFRVVQEALTNVVRHAKAKRVDVSIGSKEEFAELTVQDDGVGFDVSEARRRATAGRSIGLFSMEERVELLSGCLIVESAPGRGTKVTASLPLTVQGQGTAR